MASSSTALPPDAGNTNAPPRTSPELIDEAQFSGPGRIRDAETRLGMF